MRFVHTADLHLGRRLAQMSLERDIDVVLSQLIDVVRDKDADALVIAGDVFDSANPSEASVRQWDDFLNRLADEGIPTLVVSGNHDSGARLGMGSSLIAHTGIHIAGELRREVEHVVVKGVTFWLVPFVRPAEVRAWARERELDETSVKDYSTALQLVCDEIRRSEDFCAGPNVCVAHQFVTAGGARPNTSQSEQVSLGSLDNVDVGVFDGFDYVALGHVHRPQRIGRDTIRYAGSPLKLSASEIDYQKSFCVVDALPVEDELTGVATRLPSAEAGSENGVGKPDVAGPAPSAEVSFELVPVRPLHDFRRERGTMAELLERARGESEEKRQDYVQAVITDDDPLDVTSRLRSVWPNLEEVTFDNALTRAAGADEALSTEPVERDLAQLFEDFFEQQAGRPLATDERELALSAFEDARKPNEEE